jgi:glutathione-regulated potassium-efflux system ancillary protein KefC
MALKFAAMFAVGLALKRERREAATVAVSLAQGGEFAFVLLGPAAGGRVLPKEIGDVLILAVALSMLATPFLLVLHDRLLSRRASRSAAQPAAETPQRGKVIVAGLGRIGQVVARLLSASGYELTVLDDDPDHVEQCRKLGFRVFYGDATRLDLLHAAGAASADFLIVTLDDPAAITQLARAARKHFPGLRLVSRARDMRHLFELRDLGVEVIERETFRSALGLGEAALAAISGDATRAADTARTFAEHDAEVLARLYEVHREDADRQVAVSNELRDRLAQTLRNG